MGSLVRYALLLISLLASLFGVPSDQAQDLRERDALCNENGCFVVYFQRKTFLDSWRACKEKGGNLATIKRQEEADTIATLFSSVDLRHSRTKVQVWIGLQRQPRQCTASRLLRGFSWTTGDQDTQYTNWQREDSPSTCLAPRCVVMGYSTSADEQPNNFKWLDGSCSVPVDGYLCRYTYKGMCHALWSEGGGNALYTTPFELLSPLLTHVPFGSVATVPCPEGTKDEQSVLCMLREDGSVGWSRDAPLCSDPPISQNWCEQDNGGCEHFCREAGAHYYCECSDGFQLGEDGQSCELADVCQGAPCEFECLPLSDGYRCACPEGYMLAPDERGCLDVDECLQSPCEQLCVNAPGTFECRCRDGYRPDEEGECEDVDECANDPCEHACENTQGSHICHCHLGYSPLPEDPSQCQDIDECQIAGTCDQMCVNYDGGFECYCEVGYELMPDQFSCRKIGEEDGQPAVTRHPGPVWDPNDPVYHWTHQQSHTDWPPEVDETLDWLTDPPIVPGSDVIWVTRAPQAELPFSSEKNSPTQKPEEKDDDTEMGGDGHVPDWFESDDRAELEAVPTSTTPPPPTSPALTPTSEWYDDEEEEETTTSLPSLPTSTISEGAWNWFWLSPTPTNQDLGNPALVDPVIKQNIPVDSNDQNKGEEDGDHHNTMDNSQFPGQEVEVEVVEEYEEMINPQVPFGPTQPTPSSQPPSKDPEGVDSGNSVQGDREQKQGSSWLLVGLLVPICIFIVVMVALGIVYCTRCAVQPRNKNTTDCYHWISGAHDKQGAPNPSAGVKTNV
ncbi:CD248 molecule, endosialin a [Myripristis murdjan]|uniref:CD248 molecule, endosialin a n=1 Tax=Myripristis murdjan TaxID=586833 RepID=UPI001175CF7C|nr:complement component C1q receptor-like [Myripristis murdjan]